MDIIVTIPKSEYINDDLETLDMNERDLIQFWSLSKRPSKIEIGDRIYFLKNNSIESSMALIGIENGPYFCETTKRVWTGKVILLMNDLRLENYSGHFVGFQGFRYFQKYIGTEV